MKIEAVELARTPEARLGYETALCWGVLIDDLPLLDGNGFCRRWATEALAVQGGSLAAERGERGTDMWPAAIAARKKKP